MTSPDDRFTLWVRRNLPSLCRMHIYYPIGLLFAYNRNPLMKALT
jgi:hypothetical protein